ncbi:prepilin-type N-terminal cleavage/methylation domain-containing protein [Cellulomonas hominis]
MQARRGDRSRSRDDRGMSLVEVVVAVVVLGILASAVLAIILATQSAGVTNRNRVAAANLATRELELVRDEFTRSDDAPLEIADAGTLTNPHPLDGQVAGEPLVIDGTRYTVVRSVGWNVTGTGDSACAGGALVVYPTLGVTVTVTWPNMGSVQPVVATAVLAPAKGSGVPTTASFVAVKIVDEQARPSAGRSIKVTGGSETKTGTTDDSGCAVVQVDPAVAGTAYTVQATDSDYVDMSGTTGPTKNAGTLTPGQLNNSVTFAYAKAGAARLHLVDPAGQAIDPALLTAATVTLVASEYVGSSGATPHAVTSSTTVITGLWPTTYGAYFGTTAPAGGYSTAALTAGATIDLDVPVEMAAASVVDPPAGTTSIVATPASATGCADPSARLVDGAGFTVLPGAWSFYATGPTFDCSPGPSAVSLTGGSNDGIVWGTTMLRVTNAPAGGTLWAVNRSKVPGAALATCPDPTYAGVAANVDGARAVAVEIPAGDWYVFRTDGAASGACMGVPSGQYSKTVTYGSTTTLGWVVPTTSLTVTGVSRNSSIILSTQPAARCANRAYTAPPGGTVLTLGPATADGTALQRSVDRPGSGSQTWYVYLRNGQSCTDLSTFVVGPGTTALTKSSSTTPTPRPEGP